MLTVNGVSNNNFQNNGIQNYKIGVLNNNRIIRNDILKRNIGKYSLYSDEFEIPIGEAYKIYANEHNLPSNLNSNSLFSYTFNGKTAFSKEMIKKYGFNNNVLTAYMSHDVLPINKMLGSYSHIESNGDIRDYGSYVDYVKDVYGEEVGLLGQIFALTNTKDGLDNIANKNPLLDPRKPFVNYIYDILQHTDIKYAMEKENVGVVRDIDVASALEGVITTNINNHTNSDTRLGELSNALYARTLYQASQFNSFRRTKYITDGMERLYGNNSANVFNLSSMFDIAYDTGRISDPDSDLYIKEYEDNSLEEYLKKLNPEYELPKDINFEVYTPKYHYFDLGKINESNQWAIDESLYKTHTIFSPDANNIRYEIYSEGDNGEILDLEDTDTINDDVVDSMYTEDTTDLVSKTRKLYQEGKINTMVGRFHYSEGGDGNIGRLTQSAVSKKFGLSHGRNLLTKNAYEKGVAQRLSGYENPYCRVWTFHHQYSKMNNRIRPFVNEDGESKNMWELQNDWSILRDSTGAERLSKHSVLNKNGFVNITPTSEETDNVNVKNCMFSIENLAWKGINTKTFGTYKDGSIDNQYILSPEQRGPNGGRIMWFPPYGLEFQETANANWNKTQMIGRGEPMYTYNDSSRTGSLSFYLLVDHPSILNYWRKNRDGDESDEQTALRFFAGCEEISPNDKFTIDTYDNNKFINGNCNFNSVENPNKIIFYTFFPNNFSGVDYSSDPNFAMDVIFKGKGTDNSSGSIKNSEYSLGYEMGLNGISYDFSKNSGAGFNEELSKVFTKEEFLSEYPNLKPEDVKEIEFSFDEYYNCEFGRFNKFKDDIDGVTNASAINDLENVTIYNNELKKGLELQLEDKENVDKEIAEAWEKAQYGEQFSTPIEFKILEDKAKDIDYAIKEVEDKIEESDKKIQQIQKYTYSTETKLNKCISLIYEKTKGPSECTYGYIKPFYTLYKRYDKEINDNGEIVSNSKKFDTSYKNMGELYSSYLLKTIKEKEYNIKKNSNIRKNESINRIIFDLVKSNDLVVKAVDNNNKGTDTIFLVKDTKRNKNSIFVNSYNTFYNIKEFKNSYVRVGKIIEDVSNNAGYFVCKNGKQIVKFKNEKSVTDYVIKNGVIKVFNSFVNKLDPNDIPLDFIKSGEECAIFKTGGDFEFVYTMIDKFIGAEEKDVLPALSKEVNMKLKDGEYFKMIFGDKVRTTFQDIEEGGKEIDYAIVTCYFVKSNGNEPNYVDLQDYVNRSPLNKVMINGKECDIEDFIGGSFIANDKDYVTHSFEAQDIKYNKKVQLTTYSDNNIPDFLYPCDNDYRKQKLDIGNYSDLKSFGLNSTMLSVKKYYPDATYTFGEIYVGLYGDDKDLEQLKKCVVANLKEMQKTDENITSEVIETEVSNTEERVNYIKNVFKPIDKSKGPNITKVNIVGSASGEGKDNSNDELSINRGNSIMRFLKNKATRFDKKNIFNNDTTQCPINSKHKNISSIESKLERYSRIEIYCNNAENEIDVNSMPHYNDTDEFIRNNDSSRKKYRRYDDERLFFEMLPEKAPLSYKKLVDKIKYFTPAFHSMTPEGFNARLTFLQQCTKQGPTITDNKTASNLSFGRAPFCILRIGDFLNTKIVINSVNITYDDMKWDLNPEGIGAQLMMAKVTLGIDIIGGSDLEAPISKLQNAVSFNYYANTSVYDNRADIASYDGMGGINKVREWVPVASSKISNKVKDETSIANTEVKSSLSVDLNHGVNGVDGYKNSTGNSSSSINISNALSPKTGIENSDVAKGLKEKNDNIKNSVEEWNDGFEKSKKWSEINMKIQELPE